MMILGCFLATALPSFYDNQMGTIASMVPFHVVFMLIMLLSLIHISFGYEPKGQGFESLPARHMKDLLLRKSFFFYNKGQRNGPKARHMQKKLLFRSFFSFITKVSGTAQRRATCKRNYCFVVSFSKI